MDKELKKEANIIARIIEAELNKQKPFSKRVRVRAVVTDSKLQFIYSYPDYGDFLDLGTEKYLTPEERRGPFNRNPGTGVGGIKPRFWKTLSSQTKTRIKMLIKATITKAINAELKSAFKKIR